MASDYPVERIKRFLMALANAGPDRLSASARVISQFPECLLLKVNSEEVVALARKLEAGARLEDTEESKAHLDRSDAELIRVSAELREQIQEAFRNLPRLIRHSRRPPASDSERPAWALLYVNYLAGALKTIWKEPDQRRRQWQIFMLRLDARRAEAPDADLSTEVPNFDSFEQAMVYVDRNFERFRYCKNPECPAPFYISSTNKPTKFCSPICASPAKREARLRWYHAHPEAKGKKHVTRKAK